MSAGWIIGAIVGVIALISYVQHRAQRGTYRSLSSRQPAARARPDTPLGMEATDIEAVNRTIRRNEALERGHTNWTRRRTGGQTRASETDIAPWDDDETYAKRFHTAFHNNKD